MSVRGRSEITENPFFEQPILNSPYEYPERHWELDRDGQPMQKVIESRLYSELDKMVAPLIGETV